MLKEKRRKEIFVLNKKDKTMKRITIIGVSKKMQTAVRHLATLHVLRNLIIAVANFSLFTLHSSLLSSCDREPLELYKKGDSLFKIGYDWSKYGTPPEDGIFVMYFKDGDSLIKSDATENVVGEDHSDLESGNYKMMVMTNTFSYYTDRQNMSFYYTDDFEKMMAVSRTEDITDMNAWDAGRRYLKEPLPLGVAVDSFDVERASDDLIFYEYDQDHDIGTIEDSAKNVIWPMTTTLTIRVKVRGINYLKHPSQGGVEGYITGLADGFYFSQKWRRTQVGDIKLKYGKWRIDGYESRSTRADEPSDYRVGWLAIDIQTFGLPHGRELLFQRTEKSNFLMLHFTRINDETIDFSYDVGKMLRYQNDDGTEDATFDQTQVAMELDLEIDAPLIDEDDLPTIPYTQPKGTGAFDAEVEDWGDDENVDVPM